MFWMVYPSFGSVGDLTITEQTFAISIGNSMICSDIWHKYHEWYFEIVIRNFETILKYHEWYLCQISLQIMLLFVYTTTRKRFVIFTCRYFKLSWNTTALRKSNCRYFSCGSITLVIELQLGDHFDNHDDYALNFWDIDREVHYIIVHRSITIHCRITENAAMLPGHNHKIASRW